MLKNTPYLLENNSGNLAMQLVHKISEDVEILRRQGKLSQDMLKQLRREWHSNQVYESTGIEGNELTLHETKLLLERGITITGKKSKDIEDSRHLAEALNFLETLVQSGRQINEVDIRTIHKMVLGIEARGSGQYRQADVKISGSSHSPPSFQEVPAKMKEYNSWLNDSSRLPAPLAATVAHAWLVHIHPFSDGNGRTARALMNVILMQNGFPIVIIRRKDRQRYYDALASADNGDLGAMLSLIAERSNDSLRQIERIQKAITGVSLAVADAVYQREQAMRRQWMMWSDAARLLRSTIIDLANKASDDSHGNIQITVQEMGDLDWDDYCLISERDKGGNTWFAKLAGSSGDRRIEMLLWIGYCSDELKQKTNMKTNEPSILFSEKNHEGPHPFKLIEGNNPFYVREITYFDGSFVTRTLRDGKETVKKISSAAEVASEIVTNFIQLTV